MNSEQCALADRLADYLATRTHPWADEAVMREAVHATVQLLFGDARYETERMLNRPRLIDGLSAP